MQVLPILAGQNSDLSVVTWSYTFQDHHQSLAQGCDTEKSVLAFSLWTTVCLAISHPKCPVYFHTLEKKSETAMAPDDPKDHP